MINENSFSTFVILKLAYISLWHSLAEIFREQLVHQRRQGPSCLPPVIFLVDFGQALRLVSESRGKDAGLREMHQIGDLYKQKDKGIVRFDGYEEDNDDEQE